MHTSRRILIHNAAYTAAQTSPVIRNSVHRHARFYLDVKATAAGTGGLTMKVRGYSWNGIVPSTSGDAYGSPGVVLTAAAAVTATGVYIYELSLYPQTTSGDVVLSVARELPAFFDVQVTVGDSTSYTYSVSAELFK